MQIRLTGAFAVGAASALVMAAVIPRANAEPTNPFDALFEILADIQTDTAGVDAVEGQLTALTAAVEGLRADLGAQSDQLSQLQGDIDDLGGAVSQVQSDIDDLGGAVRSAQAGARHTWLSPYWIDWVQNNFGGFLDSEATFRLPSMIVVTNPTNETATVSCMFFDTGGSLLLDRGTTMIVGPGGSATCSSFGPTGVPPAGEPGWGGEVASGSMIVASDKAVVPYGWYMDEHINFEANPRGDTMDFVPLDCADPENPASYACQFAVTP